MQRQKSLVRRLCNLAQIILSMYIVNASSMDLVPIITQYRDLIVQLMESRGVPFTVSYIKNVRNAVMRYVSGEPLIESPGVELDSDGFPKKVSFLKPLLTDSEGVKVVLTLLTLLRAISLKPVLDTKTITDP